MLVLGGIIVLSAIALAAAALIMPLFSPGQRPAWMLFGFEVVVLVAGVLGIFVGRGNFREGPGLALACISGTVIVASGLGWLGANKQLGNTSLTPVLGVRLFLGAAVGIAGAVCVLSRNPRSWRFAAMGLAFGAPCIAVFGASVIPTGRRFVMGFLTGGGIAQTAAAIVGVIALGCFLCASVHYLVLAFELGRPEALDKPGTLKTAAGPG